MGARQGRVGAGCGSIRLGQSGWERVGGLVCNWPHEIMTSLKSTQFQGQEQGVTLTLSFNVFPWQTLFGSFSGFSLHSVPPHC